MEKYTDLTIRELKQKFSGMLNNEEYKEITDIVKYTTPESSNVINALNEAFIEWLENTRLIVKEDISSDLESSFESFPEDIEYTTKNVEDILSYSDNDSDILIFLVTFLKSGLLKKDYLSKVKNKTVSVFFRWDYSFESGDNGYYRVRHHEGEYDVDANLDVVLHDIKTS